MKRKELYQICLQAVNKLLEQGVLKHLVTSFTFPVTRFLHVRTRT